MFQQFCKYSLVALATVFVSGLAAEAYANDIAGVGGMVCRVAIALGSNVSTGIGILAIIFLAIGAFFGKVNWGTAALTAVAVYTITHAHAVLDSIGIPVDDCIAASSSSFASGSSAVSKCQQAGTCRTGAAGSAKPYPVGGSGSATPSPSPKPSGIPVPTSPTDFPN